MDKNSSEATTGLRKRQQIHAANRMVFAWIIAASLVVGVCGVFSQFLLRQLLFSNSIYSALSTTSSTLDKNISAYDGLKTNVYKLIADQNLNLLKKGEDSSALQVVIDALPTEENRAALATSMQKEVLGPAGVSINTFSVTESSAASSGEGGVVGTNAASFNFSFSMTGSYAQIQQAVKNMERSIRPITIRTISMQGKSEKLDVSITATTYYQPSKDIQLKNVEKKP